jgi:hypothetical protein
MVRKNLLHAALSLIIANLRKVWQNYEGYVIEGQYRVPCEELLFFIMWIRDERDEFVRLAQDLPLHTCYYEDLVADLGRVNAAGVFPDNTTTLGRIATFFDVPNQFRFDGKICKVINRPYAEILENYDEVVCAVKDSEFAEFAETMEPANPPVIMSSSSHLAA